MQYRIQILDQEHLPKKYIPQWKTWFLPWQNYSYTNFVDNTIKHVECKTKEMCIDYFLPRKETYKSRDRRHYPTFHFYYTQTEDNSVNNIASTAISFVVSWTTFALSILSHRLPITS